MRHDVHKTVYPRSLDSGRTAEVISRRGFHDTTNKNQEFQESLDVDFQLDPVTVLIGRSGTGKTSFVSALRYLRQTIQHGFQFDNNIFSLTKNDQEIVLEYEIEFCVHPLTEQFRYNLAISEIEIKLRNCFFRANSSQ